MRVHILEAPVDFDPKQASMPVNWGTWKPYVQQPFAPDWIGPVGHSTITVVPAHAGNVVSYPTYNRPKALVLHTPEEPVDDYESTPNYFKDYRKAATHWYADSDGDWYQMVPVRYGAIANGLLNKPRPEWGVVGVTLNCLSENVEIEGYAAGMHRSMPRYGLQWNSVAIWIEARSWYWSIPLDRQHVMRHDELASNKSDPGTLDCDLLVADASLLRIKRLMGGTMRKLQGPLSIVIKRPPPSQESFLTDGMFRVPISSAAAIDALRDAGIVAGDPDKPANQQSVILPNEAIDAIPLHPGA